MFPAAVAIVVAAFPLRERGKAMAIFFGITGGLTAIGPIAGGYLTQWTWRAIFWINIPVAIIALHPDRDRKPDDEPQPGAARLPRHGADRRRHGADRARAPAVDAPGAGASVGTWALHRRRARAAGRVRAASSCAAESPLIRLQIFRDRGFAVDNVRAVPDRWSPSSRSSSSPASTRRSSLGENAVQRRALPPVLLRRLRDRRADRRAHPRPRGRPAVRGARAA